MPAWRTLTRVVFICFMISFCKSSHPVTIQCGKVKTDLINVTFTGEAYLVYSTASELDCIASIEPNSPTVRTITGANVKNCGLKWDDNLNTYTFSVRIQNSALIDASDEIYYISCSYGDVDNQMESEFQILDPNFSMDPVDVLPANMTTTHLTVLDENNQIISTIEHGKYIKLQIDAASITSETVDVTQCSIVDNLDDNPNVQIRFLHNSCGTGYLMNSEQGFSAINETKLESELFPVYNTFYGERFISCSLAICSAGSCNQGCVIPYVPSKGVVQTIVTVTEIIVTEPPVVTTTTTRPQTTTPVNCSSVFSGEETTRVAENNVTIEKVTTDKVESDNTPFIVSIAVLVFILIVCVTLLLGIYMCYFRTRHNIRDKPAFLNRAVHFKPYVNPLDDVVDQPNALICHTCDDKRHQARFIDAISHCPNSSTVSDSVESSWSDTYSFGHMDHTDDDTYNFYCGRGKAYCKSIRKDPTNIIN